MIHFCYVNFISKPQIHTQTPKHLRVAEALKHRGPAQVHGAPAFPKTFFYFNSMPRHRTVKCISEFNSQQLCSWRRSLVDPWAFSFVARKESVLQTADISNFSIISGKYLMPPKWERGWWFFFRVFIFMENKVRKSTLSELPTALFKSKLVLIVFGSFLSSQFSLQETIWGQPSNLVFGSVSLGLVNKVEQFNVLKNTHTQFCSL